MSEITWGDTVLVLEDAPNDFRPGELGAVCGFHGSEQQTISYLVEFGDGVTIEIPPAFLSKVEISD